jgi:hypothetical protein
MDKGLFMGCVSAPMLDDVGMFFVADIEARVELRRCGSLPEMMAESFLMCAIVDGVAFCGICCGAGDGG